MQNQPIEVMLIGFRAKMTRIQPFKNKAEESNRSMFSKIQQLWGSLSGKEKSLSILVLILLWGGIAAAILLSRMGIVEDPGSFYWGCIAGSVVLAYLASGKRKRDLVSLLTPVYAIIIFLGLELPPTLVLQVLFASSLTILLYRLHADFS